VDDEVDAAGVDDKVDATGGEAEGTEGVLDLPPPP
jgi:hypothetical protein